MRRRAPAGPAVPERLARFLPGEWPGGVWEAFGSWKSERHRWYAEHFPDGGVSPLGDFLDMLRLERAVRLGIPPGSGRSHPGIFTTDGQAGD